MKFENINTLNFTFRMMKLFFELLDDKSLSVNIYIQNTLYKKLVCNFDKNIFSLEKISDIENSFGEVKLFEFPKLNPKDKSIVFRLLECDASFIISYHFDNILYISSTYSFKDISFQTMNIPLYIENFISESLILDVKEVTIKGIVECKSITTNFYVNNEGCVKTNEIIGTGTFVNKNILKDLDSQEKFNIGIKTFKSKGKSIFECKNVNVPTDNELFIIGSKSECRFENCFADGVKNKCMGDDILRKFIIKGVLHSRKFNVRRYTIISGNLYGDDVHFSGKLEIPKDGCVKATNLSNRFYFVNNGDVNVKDTFIGNFVNRGVVKCTTLTIPNEKKIQNNQCGTIEVEYIKCENSFVNFGTIISKSDTLKISGSMWLGFTSTLKVNKIEEHPEEKARITLSKGSTLVLDSIKVHEFNNEGNTKCNFLYADKIKNDGEIYSKEIYARMYYHGGSHGTLRSETMTVEGTFTNHFKLTANVLSIDGSNFLNGANAELETQNLKVRVHSTIIFEVFVNFGMIHTFESVEYDIPENCTIKNKKLIIHEGKINTNKCLFTNLKGATLKFVNGEWNFYVNGKSLPPYDLMNFENEGNWILDNVTVRSKLLNMKNSGTMYINNTYFLPFNKLVNTEGAHLIFDNGTYTVGNYFENRGLISFLGEWKFIWDSLYCKVSLPKNALLIISGCIVEHVGSIEGETLVYGFTKINSITATTSLILKCPNINIKTLELIKCPYVIWNTENLTTDENITIENINILTINVKGDTRIAAKIQVNSILLTTKSIVFGTSNVIYGTLAAIKDSLVIKCETFDGRYGKVYSKNRMIIECNTTFAFGDFVQKTNISHVSNESFIACNGPIRILGYTIGISYTQITSHDAVELKTYDTLTNTASRVSANKGILINSPKYIHTRGGTVNVGGTLYSYSESAVLESLEDICLRCRVSIVNTASDFACRNLYIQDEKKQNSPLKSSSIYKEEPYNLTRCTAYRPFFTQHPKCGGGKIYLYEEDLARYQRYSPHFIEYEYYYPIYQTIGCSIKTVDGVTINMGAVTITGNINSGIVNISSNTATFRNSHTSRSQSNHQKVDITIDLEHFIRGKIKNNGMYVEDKSGEIQTIFPMNISQFQQNRFENPGSHSQRNVFNPLRNININMWIQRALSDVSGKIFAKDLNSNKIHGGNLYEKLLGNSKVEESKSIVKLYEFEEESKQKMILYIPKEEIEESNSGESDGIKCEEFISHTEETQTFSNIRIVARDVIDILSEKGSIIRQTEKYSHNTILGDGTCMYQEYAYPQQEFTCEGDVNITGKNLYEVGVSTIAEGTINETVDENISKAPLILHRATHRTWTKDSGWFGTKTFTESTTSASILSNQTVARGKIRENAEHIHLVGAVESSSTEIEYIGGNLHIEPHLTTITYSKKCTSRGFMSKGTSTEEHTSPNSHPSVISSPIITFTSHSSKIYGSTLLSQILKDESLTGIELLPCISKSTYFQQLTCSTPMSSADIGVKGWREVMFPCNVICEKIIRDVGLDGVMKFDSVEWMGEFPEIIGNYLEMYYTLKSHQEEWNESSQLIPEPLIVVAAFAISYFTMGLGAALTGLNGLGGLIANAITTSIITNSITSFLRTGDPISSLFTKEYLKSLGVSIVTTSLIGGNPNTSTFLNRIREATLKNIVHSGVSKIIQNKKIDGSMILKNIAIESLSGEIAKKIGDAKFQKDIHSLAHFSLGSLVGYSLGGTTKSTLSGGFGALFSEIITDYALNDCGKSTKDIGYKSSIASAMMIALLNGDVDSSIYSSVNALENNRLKHTNTKKYSSLFDDEEDIDEIIEKSSFAEYRIQDLLSKKPSSREYHLYSAEEFPTSEDGWKKENTKLTKAVDELVSFFSRFESIYSKNIRELETYEYFGVPVIYTLKGIEKVDECFGSPLHKVFSTYSKYANKISTFSRDGVYKITKSPGFSQDVGTSVELALEFLAPGFLFSKSKRFVPFKDYTPIQRIKFVNPKTKIYKTTVEDYNKGSWRIDSVKCCDYKSIYNKGSPYDSLIPKIKYDKNSPFIFMGTGQPRAIVFEKHQPISGILPGNLGKKEFEMEIFLHRTKSGEVFAVRNVKMDHRLVSKYIRKYTNYKEGTPITLMSCFTGVGKNSVGQKLANKMGVPVTAPNMQIITEKRVFGRDRMVIGELLPDISADVIPTNIYRRKGKFITFYPGEGLGAEKGRRMKGKITITVCNVPCIVPLALPSTDMYFGPEIPQTKDNDAREKFVRDSSEGIWNGGCISGEIRLDDKRAKIYKEYSEVKNSIIQKKDTCPMNIVTHGSSFFVVIENIEDISDALSKEQIQAIKENGGIINAKAFSTILKKSEKYKSNPSKHINLFSCETGVHPYGFAQQLSNEMNVPVSAFTGYAGVDAKEKIFLSFSQSREGEMIPREIKTFYPELKKELSGEHNLFDRVYNKDTPKMFE
jgi:hypothetical protein